MLKGRERLSLRLSWVGASSPFHMKKKRDAVYEMLYSLYGVLEDEKVKQSNAKKENNLESRG